jgi:ribosomal protein S12 methylthiotransferase accessory factor
MSRASGLDFLQGSKEIIVEARQTPVHLTQRLETVLQFFRKKQWEVAWVDLTLPSMKRRGPFLGKAVVPALQQIFFDERFPFLGGKRLYDLPVALGYLEHPRQFVELNRIPHPFP